MEWKEAKNGDDGSISIPDNWLFLYYYEALNTLFRIENALRVFVYIVLKTQFKDDWLNLSAISDDEENTTLGKVAKQRMSQARNFGYLGYVIPCPLMYMTSGELVRLMTSEAYWKYFAAYFLGTKEVMKNKLDEIGVVRNALAHFRPIKKDDVELIKQNARHVLGKIEPCLTDIMRCANVVPTNTQDEWYTQLKTLGTESCRLSFRQSDDENWIRLTLDYKCAVIKQQGNRRIRRHRVLQINTPAILHLLPELKGLLAYLSESVTYPSLIEDGLTLNKSVIFLFNKNILSQNYKALKEHMESLLRFISEESELLKEDNLARGEIIRAVNVLARYNKTEDEEVGYWSFTYDEMFCDVKESDPPEYWGRIGTVDVNYVTSTDDYPWMPVSVSESVPF
ncbi:MAG: hypothetical protein CVU62_02375 [Deltaproteobacteria bacterium HGW-Deltaproteobacteria-2]|jgi:hypothetical protein|nr:MAG: hypothetical protein CVU62_02375 [Deltaproteobacteria bacterium HGW-Deltaproteobacteria-2]